MKNRTIDFIAWSKEFSKIIYPCDEGWFRGAFRGDNGFVQRVKLGTVIEDDRLIPIPYTGLKDKNGKKIYEGYIVKKNTVISFADTIEIVGLVKFVEGSFIIEYERNDEKTRCYLFDETKELTVLGNIYENPELLDVNRNEK